jgi:mannosyltransferase OCH1-like enzyme
MAMQISQIFLTTDPEEKLSPFLQYATSTIDTVFPKANHVIYNNEQLRDFIASVYGGHVLWAYDSLRPFSYKADLGRFCLLNYFGGWYFDIAIRAVNAVDVGDRIKFLAFRDIQRFSYTSWACATTVLYSQPNNEALQAAIEMIVANCVEQYYGITPLCPTGPTLLGKALACNGSQADFVYGDYLELTPTHEQKNRAFVLPDGTIMAWSKPAGGGDLTGLGAKSVNNYNELWAARQVYETI